MPAYGTHGSAWAKRPPLPEMPKVEPEPKPWTVGNTAWTFFAAAQFVLVLLMVAYNPHHRLVAFLGAVFMDLTVTAIVATVCWMDDQL